MKPSNLHFMKLVATDDGPMLLVATPGGAIKSVPVSKDEVLNLIGECASALRCMP